MTKEDRKKLIEGDYRYELICNRCKHSCIYEGFYQRMGSDVWGMAKCGSFEEWESAEALLHSDKMSRELSLEKSIK